MSETRLLFLADAHLGRDAFGVTGEKWSAPFREAFEIARAGGAQVVNSAGDLFNSCNPTQEAFAQFTRAAFGSTPFVDVEGNHTRGQRRDDLPAASVLGLSVRSDWQFRTGQAVALSDHVVALPWPRPVDYLTDAEIAALSIPELIRETRQRVMFELVRLCLAAQAPVILTGHAMMSYGAGEPPMLGKDVVLRYEDLCALPNVAAVLMGHVHDPGQPGYIGSTQPTDWGEAGQVKSCVLVTVNGGKVEQRRIPYTSSLKLSLKDVAVRADGRLEDTGLVGSDSTMPDVLRVRVAVPEGATFDAATFAHFAASTAGRVLPIEVIPERKVVARVETPKPLAEMPAAEALSLWLNQRETDVAVRSEVRAAFAQVREATV